MWVPLVKHLLGYIFNDQTYCPVFPPISQRLQISYYQFDWIWLVGSSESFVLKRLIKATYQLLSVLTLHGQTPNNVFAK
jgi:hypothetical protein